MAEERKRGADERAMLALAPDELATLVVEFGGQPFHARILRDNVIAKGQLDYEGMTSLPAQLRARLATELPILAGREVDRSHARDGTTKLLLGFGRAGESEALVETVHMPSLYTDVSDVPGARGPGATLCVSTQVGCPVRCPFCASGKLGLVRNLHSHEILEQFVRGRTLGNVSRAVVMGIGEPLLNYANLSRALDVVHDEVGLGARKITVSTVGFPERVRQVAQSAPRFQLAISLHTPDQEQRDELVPAMSGVPIEEVLAAADEWFDRTGREVTYEYVLLGGVNDSRGHAERLVGCLRGRRCTINLIPFNAVIDSPYRRPASATIESFRELLTSHGLVATVRWSRGVESDSACGQLRIRRLASGHPANPRSGGQRTP